MSVHWSRLVLLLQLALWCTLGVVLVRTAWVCDDAYITMRCVDNATNGYGLTYNVIERVQAFTHPLWALLILPFHAIFKSAFWEMISLGMGFSIAALVIMGRSIASKWAWIALPIIAIASKAFIEYATSGLENGLSYLLLALFVVQWWRCQMERGQLLHLSLITALILLNRLDLLMLVGPAFALACWRARSWHNLGQVVLGFLPFVLWEIFAVIYYGFPFPNTAYAKLGTMIPQHQLLKMGWGYFADSMTRDWVTLPVIALGLAVGFLRHRQWPLAIGIALYLLYVLRIGGDFMSGRFFAAPFVVALLLLGSALEQDWRRWALVAIPACLLGLLAPTPMLLSGSDYHVSDELILSPTHVADERAFFYSGTGLLHAFEGRKMPDHDWAKEGFRMGNGGAKVMVRKVIGMTGYFAGPSVHFVDPFALSDPLMARMPSIYRVEPRAGHFFRRVPAGYLESVDAPVNKVSDPILRKLYDELRIITRGPLFTVERWRAIWTANTRNSKMDDLRYLRVPADTTVQLGTHEPLDIRIAEGSAWRLLLPPAAREIRFRLSTQVGCELIWMKGDEPMEGIIINWQDAQKYNVPKGATAIALLREGGIYYAQLVQFMVD